ncbi:MAG: CDP-glycerol glycerophosphotransferase family protein [Lachnospiraceae bacterium]|nr:CDP-glycerol glycerophosphotransferase family protein [Lachnospiraceae bacterium]
MRKAQKQQIQTLISQMEEAHEQIKKYIGQGSVQPAMELLEDCQTGGVTVGTLIENTEGEGHPTVLLLEEYCELIYQIHQELEGHYKEVNPNKIYKLLRQKLIKTANSVKNDIPTRIETVFLPYKASMWDSLESVWKAADADPNCDAYVIPIPYYDKNPNGSFREMHFEGDQYPEYVPITKYETFDFGQHRPDMIYIHNPYDDLNLVTSVHPFFFSENLKKFTDKLVYIPYFVLGEIKPDEDNKIEGMKHFCTLPAVYNADKVIVQSEDMRQVYIKVLLEASDDHSEAARKYWEDKILGLGSPKFDKLANTRREDIEIPDEWMKIIQKPDGSWKKIIFYNTSIAGLLAHNQKMLAKMKYVFQVFKENQDEVALLWRPHPLIKATVESMRPQLWIEYDNIARKYIEEGWGIYDDTADVDRAIALSDAYYGDHSSVVQLYQQTGKPVMVQNVEMVN